MNKNKVLKQPKVESVTVMVTFDIWGHEVKREEVPKIIEDSIDRVGYSTSPTKHSNILNNNEIDLIKSLLEMEIEATKEDIANNGDDAWNGEEYLQRVRNLYNKF